MSKQPKPRLGVVTCARWPAVTPDDGLALDLLTDVAAEAAPWNLPRDWSAYDALVFRSCWDYHTVPEDFLAWLDDIERLGILTLNPLVLLRANLHKRYLTALHDAGCPVIPTRWIAPDDAVSLDDIMREAGWSEAVVKPAIGASAWATFRTTWPDAPESESAFEAARRAHGALVQPFVPEILCQGEWSLVFFGGQFSHCVLKRPRTGDFRVQAQHGGTHRAAPPPPGAPAAARAALEVLCEAANFSPDHLAYARVDGVQMHDAFHLMEVELIEPVLFLDADAQAPARFARQVQRLLPATLSAPHV